MLERFFLIQAVHLQKEQGHHEKQSLLIMSFLESWQRHFLQQNTSKSLKRQVVLPLIPS